MANYIGHTSRSGSPWEDFQRVGTMRAGGLVIAAVAIGMWVVALNVLAPAPQTTLPASEPSWAAQPIADSGSPLATIIPGRDAQDEAAVAAPAEPSAPAAAAPGTGTTTEGSDANVYVVVAGDTMARIAQRHSVTLAALLAANPEISDPSRIEIGQRIRLP